MADQQEHSQADETPKKRLKKRTWVLIILVCLIGGSIFAVTYYPSPEFFFKVDDERLTLYKGGWKLLGARKSNAVEPIRVEGMDVEPLLEKSYNSLDAALADYAMFMPEWIVGQEARVSQLEKELVSAYDALLVGLRAATSVGLAEYEKEINRLKRKIKAHKDNLRRQP